MDHSSTEMDDPALALSPIEHAFSGPHSHPITILFFFSSVLDRESVQASLTRAVARFPWLWSHLEQSEDGRCYRLVRHSEPALLEDGSTCAAIGGKTQYVGPLDLTLGRPLARFCLTETAEGSVVGVSMSHAIADGASFFYFMASWARLAREQPIHDPVRLPMALTSAASDELTPARVAAACGLFRREAHESLTLDSIREDLLYLTPGELDQLRDRAQRESSMRLSTNDVVTAYLWQRLGPSWCEQMGVSASYLSCPVDMRSVGVFPPNHFGSALGFAVTSMDAERLRAASLGELAMRVRQAVNATGAEALLRANERLDSLRRTHGLAALQELYPRNPSGGMLITNMTRVPVAELDFGSGAPTHFISDAQLYYAAALYAHPTGLQIRVFGKTEGPSPAVMGASPEHVYVAGERLERALAEQAARAVTL